MQRLSFVIPCYNESESLPQLHEELHRVCTANGYVAQIVFVDDGSTDASWGTIERLAQTDPEIEAIRFRRNFGKAAALDAGFAAATGEIVFTLDADLQDDPKEIPRFLAKLDEGFDVVSGWKQTRHDPWHKVIPSRFFNALVSGMTGVTLHDHNCGFKCYRREIFDEVQLYGELHRFVPVLAAARGWKVSEIVVDHRARQFGRSKYGVRRFVKGFLDLLTVYFLTSFNQRPQHLLGTIGLIAFLLGGLASVLLAITWVVNALFELGWEPLHQRPAVIYSIGLMLLGSQFLLAGFLAELMTANFRRGTRPYSVRERLVRPTATVAASLPSAVPGAESAD
jgi:dolichol-phosphate mannosyltransferase